ncbi:MAG: diaminopimelate epimerase [Bacteroidota bacterium]|jgi:diaminopimelate epimerase
MTLHFYKYQGTGNDFVIIDNRTKFFDIKNTALIKKLCDRRFGIGADGFMLLENVEGYDFKMVYFNADGNESSMCGNGGRCLVAFAYKMEVFKDTTTFLAIDGLHEASIKDGIVKLKMIDVNVVEENDSFSWLNTGSPHYIKQVQDIEKFPVFEEGKSIRYNDRFKAEGTNVNFVEQIGDNQIFVRTYERGVEDETYSCGTGVTAAALVNSRKGLVSPIEIKTLGGNLSVAFKEDGKGGFKDVYLCGPAELVFEGDIEI